ncbi:DUF188 domain-containing protein [Fusibacter sp. 3D3]|uniref:YaiI/YqxD family protein n=1 Tax=Fusibacter sp. 3D3 TaxID=1048380 RepID=UPI000853D2C7|nr:DUF188 domain-containing protein [Fusibacter sp. 3D3]GAU75834.1 protein of unknown function DUF188 [Fusibacter sp. 3D3]
MSPNKPRIWVDADGCPVVKIAIEMAQKEGYRITVVKNHAVVIEDDYAEIITVDLSRDAADFYIVNHMMAHDIVITQDYGLAALVLSKRGQAINQNGRLITQDNIDLILDQRHVSRLARMQRGKYTKFKKRLKADDEAFVSAFKGLLER